MTVSIIIPIYNTATCLRACLASVRSQTYRDYEVIMIDDGSTDNSAKVCKEFEALDNRFHYFRKEHGGSGSARNYGIDRSSGDYIAFIDSDDRIDDNYLETLAEYADGKRQIVQCGLELERSGSVTVLSPENREYCGRDFALAVLGRDYPIFLFQTVTTKLYSRDLIVSSGVRFNPEVINSVDCLFNTDLLPYISSVKTISAPLYHYLQDNSYVSRIKPSYNKIFQNIRVGVLTAETRYKLIRTLSAGNDPKITRGFHKAICIIYLSNAREIELSGLSKKEKIELYDSYFSKMNYPVKEALDDFSRAEQKIILASAGKNRRTIALIYKLKKIKRLFVK